MKKLLPFSLCLLMLLSGCARANTLTGRAQGYGGELVVVVTMNGDIIESVEVTENNETKSVAGEALTRIPEEIAAANSADVDAVSGATITSNAIMQAVKNAMGAAQTRHGSLCGPGFRWVLASRTVDASVPARTARTSRCTASTRCLFARCLTTTAGWRT